MPGRTVTGGWWVGAAARRLDRWLNRPAPAERLALFRILAGLFATVYLAVRLPAFLATAHLDSGFDGVGVLWFLDRPLPPAAVTTLVWACLPLGAAFALGLWFRLTGPAFALGLLVVATYRSSWGQLLYFDNLLVLHLLVLACSPADHGLRPAHPGASGPGDHTPRGGATGGSDPGRPVGDARYGWPLRLCALITVATYVLAGVAKLRIGGPGWLSGTVLRNHIAYSAARLEVLGGTPSPLARPLMGHPALLTPLAVATVVLELGAPAALWPRLRLPVVAGLWLFHAGVAATMFVVFPYPLLLVAFAPLFDLERAAGRVAGRVAGPFRPRRRPWRTRP